MQKRIAIGVDIGGSHITCKLYDLESNIFVEGIKIRKSIDCHSGKSKILLGWADAIRETAGTFRLEDFAGIGFAMPGPFDYSGGIAWFRDVNKFENLYGVNIRSEIIRILGLPVNFPVRFGNDAACFAIGESFQGEASKLQRLLAITLGTGFGTTFIDSHLPVAGKYNIPNDGFLYRVPFGDSVADEYFSTRWFINEYKTRTGKQAQGVKELAELAETDSDVGGLFNSFGSNLGSFLTSWLIRFGARCLVIGGNISAAYPLFRDEMLRKFENAGLQIPVLISTLQEDAALAGGASLCNNELYSKLLQLNQ